MQELAALTFLVSGICYFVTGTTYLLRKMSSPCTKEDT
jgi:hypothetical protein